jgi:hypothetical protein
MAKSLRLSGKMFRESIIINSFVIRYSGSGGSILFFGIRPGIRGLSSIDLVVASWLPFFLFSS